MPIVTMQRRIREAGRIRLGEQRTKNGKRYPAKLATFRFTSQDEAVVRAAAELFGGEARPWENQGRQEWEVVTGATSVEVMVPPTDMAFSQFYELWSGGGCQRRCTGALELISDQPCLCDPEDRECKPTTRLSVMVPDLPVVGLWRLESHGYNAAEELLGSVDLAQAFAARGRYLPAQLRIDLREKRKPGEPTKKFAVPVLDLRVSMRELHALSVGADPATGELPAGNGGNGHAQVGPAFSPVPELPEGPSPSIAEQVGQVGTEGPGRGRTNAAEPIKRTGLAPRARGASTVVVDDEESEQASGKSPTPASDGGGAGPVDTREDVPASSPPSDATSMQLAQRVAMYCKDEGVVTDDERHRFLAAFSEGRYDSAKDVTIEELPALRATLVQLRRGEMALAEVGGGWQFVAPGDASGSPEQSELELWDRSRWLAAIENVPGIGQSRLLKRARDLAGEMGVDAPMDLDGIGGGQLGVALMKWLRGQQ